MKSRILGKGRQGRLITDPGSFNDSPTVIFFFFCDFPEQVCVSPRADCWFRCLCTSSLYSWPRAEFEKSLTINAVHDVVHQVGDWPHYGAVVPRVHVHNSFIFQQGISTKEEQPRVVVIFFPWATEKVFCHKRVSKLGHQTGDFSSTVAAVERRSPLSSKNTAIELPRLSASCDKQGDIILYVLPSLWCLTNQTLPVWMSPAQEAPEHGTSCLDLTCTGSAGTRNFLFGPHLYRKLRNKELPV